MARPASLTRDTVIAGIYEADKLWGFTIQQRVAAFRIGRRGIVPCLGIARQHMRLFARGDIRWRLATGRGITPHSRIAAMAVGAAKPDSRTDMHRRRIGFQMTAETTRGLGIDLSHALFGRRSRRANITARYGLFLFAGADLAGRQHHQQAEHHREETSDAHQ